MPRSPTRIAPSCTPRPDDQGVRRGLTLIELIFVLVLLGMLALLLAPQLRGATSSARATTLAGRIRAIQTAYAGANEPEAEALRSSAGTVPAALTRALGGEFFHGEAGITLSIVGEGKEVWIRMEGGSAGARQTLAAFHAVVRLPSLHTPNVTLVPLSAAATELADAIRRTSGSSGDVSRVDEAQRVPGDRADRSAANPGTTPGDSAASTEEHGSRIAPPERTTEERTRESNPVCAPTLPPAQYQRCLRATSSGWFRN
jgi:prepilin-type N-terminal cleavage/methylation domain-containing protein